MFDTTHQQHLFNTTRHSFITPPGEMVAEYQVSPELRGLPMPEVQHYMQVCGRRSAALHCRCTVAVTVRF